MRSTHYLNLALAAALAVSTTAFAQTAGQDMHHAGHETKEAVKDAGHGIKSGTEKTYDKSQHGTKKVYHQSKHVTKKTYHKTVNGTENMGDRMTGKPPVH